MYLKTIKEVFFVPTDEEVVHFYEFFDMLSAEGIDYFYDMALLELGLHHDSTYTCINPLGLDTLAEDNVNIIRSTIFRFFLVRVGYDPRKAMRVNLDYKTNKLLAFDSVFLNENDGLHNRYEWLLKKRKIYRDKPVSLCRVKLATTPHYIFNIAGSGLDNDVTDYVMCYVCDEDSKVENSYTPENRIWVSQPKEFLPDMFRVNDRGYVYDVMYSHPKNRKKEE